MVGEGFDDGEISVAFRAEPNMEIASTRGEEIKRRSLSSFCKKRYSINPKTSQGFLESVEPPSESKLSRSSKPIDQLKEHVCKKVLDLFKEN